MQPTKTIISLDRWEQAVRTNELQILGLAETEHLVVFDPLKGFLSPVHCCEEGWRLESMTDEELIT